MQEAEIPTACTTENIARSKLQRISAAAVSALERRLQEHRLPVEEQAFLSARLDTYRKAAALAADAGCGCPSRCTV
jgi:hypothetical protein